MAQQQPHKTRKPELRLRLRLRLGLGLRLRLGLGLGLGVDAGLGTLGWFQDSLRALRPHPKLG